MRGKLYKIDGYVSAVRCVAVAIVWKLRSKSLHTGIQTNCTQYYITFTEFSAGVCVKVWNHSTKWQDFVPDELLHCTHIDTPFACTSDRKFTLSVLMIRNFTKPTNSFSVSQNTSSSTVISHPGWRSWASWSGFSLTARQWSRNGRCRDISGPASISFIRLVWACS